MTLNWTGSGHFFTDRVVRLLIKVSENIARHKRSTRKRSRKAKRRSIKKAARAMKIASEYRVDWCQVNWFARNFFSSDHQIMTVIVPTVIQTRYVLWITLNWYFSQTDSTVVEPLAIRSEFKSRSCHTKYSVKVVKIWRGPQKRNAHELPVQSLLVLR